MIYIFDTQNYQKNSDSLIFANWDVKTILPQYIELAWNQGSSVALRQFEKYIL